MLAARRGEALMKGLVALGEALHANQTDDSDQALAKASDAAEHLRATGNQAGVLRADFEQIYALQSLRPKQCFSNADLLKHKAAVNGYAWIRPQAILQQGNCYSLQGDVGFGTRSAPGRLRDSRS